MLTIYTQQMELPFQIQTKRSLKKLFYQRKTGCKNVFVTRRIFGHEWDAVARFYGYTFSYSAENVFISLTSFTYVDCIRSNPAAQFLVFCVLPGMFHYEKTFIFLPSFYASPPLPTRHSALGPDFLYRLTYFSTV